MGHWHWTPDWEFWDPKRNAPRIALLASQVSMEVLTQPEEDDNETPKWPSWISRKSASSRNRFGTAFTSSSTQSAKTMMPSAGALPLTDVGGTRQS